MTTSIRVRPAKSGDAAAVQRVLMASYPGLMARAYDRQILRQALPLMTRANHALLACGTYYVAEIEGHAIMGCGGWTRDEPGSSVIIPGIAHIRHFAVDAAWVGRGIGRALFERCEMDACADGIRLFKCFASLNSVAFYRALGFECRGTLEITMGPGIRLPSMLMERPL